MTPAQRSEKISEVVQHLASAFTRRCWWADKSDLIQEGWCGVLEGWPTVLKSPELPVDVRPAEFGSLIYRIVACRLTRYLWRQSSPVSSKSAPERRLRGIFRAKMPGGLQEPSKGPEAQVIAAEGEHLVPKLRELLRQQIRNLASNDNRQVVEAVVYVLVDGEPPNRAAELAGVPVERVYYTTGWVKEAAASHDGVRRILKRIKERRSDYEATGS